MSEKLRKKESKAVLVMVPRPMAQAMDHCVQRLDLDRSKFVRAAIREKLQRHEGSAR